MSEKSIRGLPGRGWRPQATYRAPIFVAAALLLGWSWRLFSQSHITPLYPVPPSFDELGYYTNWDDIAPSETLHWVPCFRAEANFLCARLTVPMDYQRPLSKSADNPKVHVAMVLLPGAGHGLESGRFSVSPLLINPGGPGGSGTEVVLTLGQALQSVVGQTHDIIGFDPRGIGATTPPADCFVSSPEAGTAGHEEMNRAMIHRLTWSLGAHEVGLPNSSAVALTKLRKRSSAIAELCKRSNLGSERFDYMATPNVAADMKTIVEAWDDWIDRTGFSAETSGGLSQPGADVAWPPDTKGKLVYWGFSYGTLLGATFASMFPESVGRLILDGVVDVASYAKPAWIDSLRDADTIIDKFLYYCHLAQNRCKLYRPNDTVADIRRRYHSAMKTLRTDPPVVISPSANMPVVLTESDIRLVVFLSLYFPTRSFPMLALILDTVYAGGDLSPYIVAPDLSATCAPNFKMRSYLNEASVVIGCSDRGYTLNGTIAGLEDQMRRIAKRTTLYDVWTSLMLGCEDWAIEAKYPAPNWDHKLKSSEPIDTAFPVLFIGNTHDPVTPFHSAVKMTQKFSKSGLLEVLTEGHTTLATVSLCAILKIRLYIDAGIVPAHPTIDNEALQKGNINGQWEKCKADEHPWKNFGSSAETNSEDSAHLTAVEAELLHSWRDMQRASDEIVKHFAHPAKLDLNGYHMPN